MAERQSSIGADGTTKSRTCLEPTSTQPSAQDVASRCSTKNERPSLPFAANDESCFILLAVLDGLASNMLSEDMWELAMYKAEDSCKALGVSHDRFVEIVRVLAEVRRKRLAGNMLSAMF